MVDTKWPTSRWSGLIRLLLAVVALLVVGTVVWLMVEPGKHDSHHRKAAGDEARVLDVYNWPYYMVPDLLSEFESACRCKVNYREFGTNEDLYAAMKNRTGQWDVVFPSDYMVARMAKEGMLRPLDKQRLPGIQNLDTAFLNPHYDRGNQYSLPYIWGATGIGYLRSKVQNVQDYDTLWSPALRNRIGMLDDVRFSIGAALKRLGYSANTVDDQELAQAHKALLEQKSLVRAYNSENYVDLLTTGEVWAFYGYSGDFIQAMPKQPDLAFRIPASGGILYVDNMAIPVSTDAPELAHEFIDFLLKPHVAARIINERWFAMPNRAAEGLVRREVRTNEGVYPPRDVINKCEQLRDLGPAISKYESIWQRVKAK